VQRCLKVLSFAPNGPPKPVAIEELEALTPSIGAEGNYIRQCALATAFVPDNRDHCRVEGELDIEPLLRQYASGHLPDSDPVNVFGRIRSEVTLLWWLVTNEHPTPRIHQASP